MSSLLSVPTQTRRSTMPRIAVLLTLVAATIFGAWQLAFLCDDAYIHFRYASNLYEGKGLVWNAAPFQPVEGGGFLWILILCAIWILFGVEPPDAANVVLITCGVIQVLILAAAANRLRRQNGSLLPSAVGLCAVAAIISNRTFLQWMSSGLDTALFNVWLLAWVMLAFRSPEQRRGNWLPIWSLLAAMAALTRPDGLPLVCATAGVAVADMLQRRRQLQPTLLGLLPLLLVLAHMLWRHSYYGEWLPNTYYAKVGGAWPEAGARYFACFALENGAWLWALTAITWVGFELRRGLRAIVGSLLTNVPALAAVVVALFNAGYYCFKVGGDHFEYRVLSQLVPLGTLTAVAMVGRMSNRPLWPILASFAMALAGSLGSVHLPLTSDPGKYGIQAITPSMPAFAKPLSRWFDKQQAWLFLRYIGLRSNHHTAVLNLYAVHYPRRLAMTDSPDPFPMLATGGVGLPAWYLPDCAIIDLFGLNDWVIARTHSTFAEDLSPERMREAVEQSDGDRDGYLTATELSVAVQRATQLGSVAGPATPGSFVFHYLISIFSNERRDAITLEQAVAMSELVNTGRMMAHEHSPPPGYLAALEPNVSVLGGVVTFKPRSQPMTAERIRSIEREWRDRILAK